MSTPAPVDAADRIESLDVLRGFALLGILAMNIRMMAAPFGAYMFPYAMWDFEGGNRVAFVVTAVFFDLKMMGLFSMLFGAGVLLYAGKTAPGEAAPAGLWFRRMAALLAIGLVHAYLIWNGDILVPYALCGLLLLWWVRNLSARALLIGGLAMLTVGALLNAGQAIAWQSMTEADRAAQLLMMSPTPEQVQQQLQDMLGGYTSIVSSRAQFVLLGQTMFFALFFLWRCGGMMLLGMALFKYGFLDGRKTPAFYARTAIGCLVVGVALSSYGFVALDRVRFMMPDRAIADIWNYVGAVFTSIGYAAALLYLVTSDLVPALRRRLAAVGRMAFSNYLAQSVITAVLFLGWGFGLAGRFDYAEQLGVVVAIWILQLVWSPIWLARFRFGPAEWLWRSLTYGRVQPFSRPQANPVGAM
jgi:uncharacterized protein